LNDQDYIRKAVELADGWRLSNDKEPLIYLDDGTSDGISFMSWSYPQFMLDALAAQLVRQVDALPGNEDITRQCILGIWAESTSVIDLKGYPHNETLIESDDTDRTMNTIKAVVDSGVLSGQKFPQVRCAACRRHDWDNCTCKNGGK